MTEPPTEPRAAEPPSAAKASPLQTIVTSLSAWKENCVRTTSVTLLLSSVADGDV